MKKMKCFKFIVLVYLVSYICNAESASLNKEIRYKEVYQLALSLARKKEFSNAINYFQYLLKIKPKDDKVRFLLAKAHYLNNNVSKALMVCHKAVGTNVQSKCNDLKLKSKSIFPNEYMLFDAHRLLNEGRLEKSRQIAFKLLQSDSNNPKYRFVLGKVLHRQGDFYRAFDHYNYVKDFVNRPQRSKIQKLIAKLQTSVKPLIEYVKRISSESSEVGADEYWQMYCLAIHMAASEFSNDENDKTDLAISYLKTLLNDEKLNENQRYNLLMPMMNLYSLKGNAERAYELIQLARRTKPDIADNARLKFAEELLMVRHPMLNRGMLK
tara:strand:- start:104 stop:1078 length:975 start_codon:yes stop_codon:yes gene_type:complete